MRPCGYIIICALLCCAATGNAQGKRHAGTQSAKHRVASKGGHARVAKSNRHATRRRNKPLAPPPMPSQIEVLAVDSATGVLRVALTGPSRPPETRLFVLTDDLGRRFVPATADCIPDKAEPTDDPAMQWRCSLTIAKLYRRANLTGVAMEWGDRAVNALPGQVKSRWAEAHAATPLGPPSTGSTGNSTGSSSGDSSGDSSGQADGAGSPAQNPRENGAGIKAPQPRAPAAPGPPGSSQSPDSEDKDDDEPDTE